MENTAILPRWQETAVRQTLSRRRVLVLSGARQTGKTTLAQHLSGSRTEYRTLDDFTLLEAARSDPQTFVAHDDNLLIIDEIQRAPELLQAIKAEVDRDRTPGRFLLTGSANIRELPGVNESLAGRVRTLRLRPLAAREVARRSPDFLEAVMTDNRERLSRNASLDVPCDKELCIRDALRGGYPEALQFGDLRDTQDWHRDYLAALLERDMRDVANIRRQDALRTLLRCLAAWSSRYMDITGIGRGLSIRRPTIETYITALETLYLVERVRPWLKTDYERIGKKDKLYFTDTGLMASCLDWRPEDVMFDGDKNGKLLETRVFTQLAAIIDAQPVPPVLYHYRDRQKREVDFVVELPDGACIGIEVKAGSVVKDSSFQHLRWFRDNLVGNRPFIGIVLYTGNHVMSFGDNLRAVPLCAL
ncbi:MAG: ATP-binding protein [Pseudohongiellaceae bacterium]